MGQWYFNSSEKRFYVPSSLTAYTTSLTANLQHNIDDELSFILAAMLSKTLYH